MPKIAQPNNWVYHRRADFENESDHTALSIEWGEFEAVTETGESLALEFVPCQQSINLGLNASNEMDYLTTQPTTLPATVEQLRFHYHIFTSCQRDTLDEKIVTDFTNFNIIFWMTDLTHGQRYPIKASFANADGAINDQQEITVAVSTLAGASVMIKPELSGISVAGKQFSYSLGHIYIEADKALPKPLPSQLKILEPETFTLLQNYPNPFNAITRIKYSIAKAGTVNLTVYDLLGQEVAILVNHHQPVGSYEVMFDASHLASGIYVYRIEASSFVASKKLVLIR